MNSWLQDVRYGWRMLMKSPGFSVVAILSLALGIGANSGLFSLIDVLLLRPLPEVQQPEGLVYLSRSYSYPEVAEFRDNNNVFDHLVAQAAAGALNLEVAGHPELAWGQLVSWDYFAMLGVHPALGRFFLPEEDKTPGTHPVVVLSHRFWERRLNSDSGIVGKAIRLNGLQYTVVGVAARDFVGTEVGPVWDLWAPMMMQPQLAPGNTGDPNTLGNRQVSWINVIGRRKPGVSLQQAQTAINALRQNLHPEAKDADRPNRAIKLYQVVGGVDPRERMDFFPVAGLLLSVVGAVLLIACLNLANLLLARGARRCKEVGVRLALGASRWRVARQLLVESLLMAFLGGALGLVFTLWTSAVIAQFEPLAERPIAVDAGINPRVLLFTLLVSVLTGILFGLLPALQASRRDVVAALKDSALGRAYRRSRLRNGFVVAQVAVSLILLICAGLFVRSLRSAQNLDPGFATQGRLVVRLNLRLAGLTAVNGTAFYKQTLQRVQSLPGVVSASLARIMPFSNSRGATVLKIEGRENDPEGEVTVGYNAVGPKYFMTMGIPVLRGRDFDERDTTDQAVIINEAMANRYWPGQEALGKRVVFSRGVYSQVVGVVRNANNESLGAQPKPYLYAPLFDDYSGTATLVVQVSGDPGAMIPTVRSQLSQMNSGLGLYEVQTMSQYMRAALLPARMGAGLLSGFGLLALALAAIGIYGVLSYSVAQRVHELGVRMALGATQPHILRLVLGEGMGMILLGVLLGLAAAAAVTRLLSIFLYGISTLDPLTYVLVPLLLAAVAFLAGYLPARRAAAVDPMVALRYE